MEEQETTTITGEERIGYIESELNRLLPATIEIEKEKDKRGRHQIIVNNKRVPFAIFDSVEGVDSVFKNNETLLLMSMIREIKNFS